MTFLTGKTVLKYWRFVEYLKQKNLSDTKGLKLTAQALLFLMRLRHGLSYDFLKISFDVDKMIVKKYFWKIALLYYHWSNAYLRMWTEGPSDERKNHVFQRMIDDMDPIYKLIAGRMKDPQNRSRKCYIILIDSTKIGVQKSSDFEFQKGTFYGKDQKHCISCTNITTTSGKICCIATSSCSISPRHGDGVLSAFQLKEDLVR